MNASPTKFDPNTVAQLKALLAEQEAAKLVAADEIRAEIAVADQNLRSLRAKLAELVPPVVVIGKARRSSPAGENAKPSADRDTILAQLQSGDKTTAELKAATNGTDSTTWYHTNALKTAGLIHSVSHGVWALGPAPTAPAAPESSQTE